MESRCTHLMRNSHEIVPQELFYIAMEPSCAHACASTLDVLQFYRKMEMWSGCGLQFSPSDVLRSGVIHRRSVSKYFPTRMFRVERH